MLSYSRQQTKVANLQPKITVNLVWLGINSGRRFVVKIATAVKLQPSYFSCFDFPWISHFESKVLSFELAFRSFTPAMLTISWILPTNSVPSVAVCALSIL